MYKWCWNVIIFILQDIYDQTEEIDGSQHFLGCKLIYILWTFVVNENEFSFTKDNQLEFDMRGNIVSRCDDVSSVILLLLISLDYEWLIVGLLKADRHYVTRKSWLGIRSVALWWCIVNILCPVVGNEQFSLIGKAKESTSPIVFDCSPICVALLTD